MKTIAITGCVEHIGTTTQAIQLLLSLKQKYHKVCYLESNKTGYINNIKRLKPDIKDQIVNIDIKEIKMYKKSFFKVISPWEWDYLIRDYGNADSNDFDQDSFAKQKTKIVVCGSKPNEIFKLQELVLNPIYDGAYYVFSFVPEHERISILSLMGSQAKQTYFSDLLLDPFSDVLNVSIYDKLINNC